MEMKPENIPILRYVYIKTKHGDSVGIFTIADIFEADIDLIKDALDNLRECGYIDGYNVVSITSKGAAVVQKQDERMRAFYEHKH